MLGMESFFSKAKGSANKPESLPIPVRPPEKQKTDEMTAIETRIRNLRLTIEDSQRRLAQLNLDIASIQIEYNANPEHPGVIADNNLRQSLLNEITGVQEDIAKLTIQLEAQIDKMRQLKEAA